jgi:FecR protein
MGQGSLRPPATALAVAPFLVLAGVGLANAACYSSQQQLPAQTVTQFTTNPAQLLTQYPDGGPAMISMIRDLVASNPTTLPLVINLLPNASTGEANSIGTGLGQAALICVHTDQAFATEIQQALASASGSGIAPRVGASAASDQPKIGNAVAIKDQVVGVTERGSQPVTAGSEVYASEVLRTGPSGKVEVLLGDRTNVTAAPSTEIRLDKFAYDPGSGTGNVVVVGTSGAFRFITGLQPHQNYTVKTPLATITVRGTEFIVVITPNGVEIQLISGELTVTTNSGQAITLSTPYTVLTINSQGNTQGPTADNQPLVDLSDLGAPITTLSLAEALAAFSAATGNTATGATGAGGGGGGGGGATGVTATGFNGGSSGGTSGVNTFVVTTPTNFFSLSFTESSSTPGSTTTTTTSSTSSVSPSR